MSVRFAEPLVIRRELYTPKNEVWVACMHDWIECESDHFILEKRESILNQASKFDGSPLQILQRRILLTHLQRLEEKFDLIVLALIDTCGRIEHLARCLNALEQLRQSRKCRLGINIRISEFSREMRYKEDERWNLLELVDEVVVHIGRLGSA